MVKTNVSSVLIRSMPLAGLMATAAATSVVHADWPQWGGPNRDFSAAKANLADQWPENGLRRLWRRDLGEGYSAIIAQDGVLYTMYRTGKTPHAFTVALDAKTGQTIWETKHDSPIPADMKAHPGPHSTPLLAGDRLFSVGRNAVLRCYDKKDGRLIWDVDLRTDYGSKYSQWGYSPSPIAYGDLVIAPVGRKRPDFEGGTVPENEEEIKKQEAAAEGRTLMAFSQTDGRLVWKSEDEGIDHTSPMLMKVNGQDQLILLTPQALFAVAPLTGKLLWRHAFERVGGCLVTPIVIGKDLLYISGSDTGSHLFRLASQDGKTVPELLWKSRKLCIAFSNPVVVGDFVIGSSGNSNTVVACLNAQTGKRLWADRSMARATIVQADGKLIMLDENGQLALATVDADGMTVHSEAKVADRESYTPPTLVGTTLYLRDRKSIMAYDLGVEAGEKS